MADCQMSRCSICFDGKFVLKLQRLLLLRLVKFISGIDWHNAKSNRNIFKLGYDSLFAFNRNECKMCTIAANSIQSKSCHMFCLLSVSFCNNGPNRPFIRIIYHQSNLFGEHRPISFRLKPTSLPYTITEAH